MSFKLKEQIIPEKIIENHILTTLWYHGIYAWKNQSVGIFDSTRGIYRKPNNKFHIKGVSDILGILPGGRLLAIEVKSAKGKASAEQEMFLLKINSCGGVGFVARSFKEVEEKMKELGVIK